MPLVHRRYEPRERLGQGGQGEVVRVVDREDRARPLVAKVWRPGAFDAGALAGEFALLARQRIPGLVRAHDLGRDERTQAPFLVEDYVEGCDAEEHVALATGTAAGVVHLLVVLALIAGSYAVLMRRYRKVGL